jgi:hypothetical protein
MAAYAQDFQSKSQGLLGYVQGQLSQAVGWSALPGQLNKIVASSAGFVWGFNAVGNFYTCKEPCDGTNWKQVDNPKGINGMPLDIAVDAQNVYVLFNSPLPPPSPTTASVNTWPISIGDVGMPPGHVSITDTGALVSTRMYGTDFGFSAVEKGVSTGGKYTVTLTDNAGVSATFPLTSITGSGGFATHIQGGSGLLSKFSKSKTVSVTITPTVSASASPGSSGLSFATQPVDGTGSWSDPQAIPGSPSVNPQINITDQFIFVGNQGCSKPCTTGSWVAISEPQGSGKSMGVVAASSGSTYVPVNNSGKIKVYAGTGNGQGGWTEQAGLRGKIPIAVEADNQFLYAQDQGSGGIYRCGAPYSDVTSCELENTQGNTVSGTHTISVNPRSYQTYLAAASSGSVGNLYQRLDSGSVDVAPLIAETKKYASDLDSDVNALGTATTAQSAALAAAQTREEAMAAIEQITDLDDKFKETRIKQGNMRSKIVNDKAVPLSTARLSALKVVAITLVCTIVIHLILSMFLSPTVVMGISIGVLAIGVFSAYSYLGAGVKVSISSLKE